MSKLILTESQYNKLKYVLLESEKIKNLTVDIKTAPKRQKKVRSGSSSGSSYSPPDISDF